MRAKTVQENFGGAGYAVYGGGSGGGYGNSIGRGSGFGQSSNSGGPNLMYTYDIKPLNQLLQQPATPQGDDRYIHPGSEVAGKVLGKDEYVEGKIISIKEDADHNILYYKVLVTNTGQTVRMDPTSVELNAHEERPDSYMRDIIVGESFYPAFDSFISEGEKRESSISATCPYCEKKANHTFTHYDDLKKGKEVLFTCPHCKKKFQGKLGGLNEEK
jgi:hypothetical protein